MFKNLFKLKKRDKPACDHYRNFRMMKSFTEAGVPYLDHECYDCGFRFRGRIHVDPKGWDCRLICAEEGLVLIDRIPEPVGSWNEKTI